MNQCNSNLEKKRHQTKEEEISTCEDEKISTNLEKCESILNEESKLDFGFK